MRGWRRAAQSSVRVTVCVLALGCSGSTDGTTKVIVATQIQPSAFRAADTVRVTSTVTNVTLIKATLETNTCDAPFEVLDPQGRVVGPGFDRLCPTGSVPLLLDAGVPYDLNGFFTGLSVASAPGNKVYLSAGTYRIRAKARVAEVGVVRGPAIEFRITP